MPKLLLAIAILVVLAALLGYGWVDGYHANLASPVAPGSIDGY
jgi:type II secretory pathway pseudopilin PulG